MKKRLVKFATLIIALLLGFSALAGCKLTYTDNAKDMAQVVAEVNIGNEGQKTYKIYKKDLVLAYLSYGYMYTYYYGYTAKQTYNTLLDSLVGTRVMVQYIMKDCEDNSDIKDSSKEKWDIERYITADEKVEAKYNAILSINNSIDGYVTAGEKGVTDTLADTVRTVPKDAKNAEDPDLTIAEMQAEIDKGIYDIAIGEKRHTAYNRFIRLFSNSGMLNDYKNDILTTEYFKNMLVNQEEQMLMDRFGKDFQTEERNKITYETLSEKYAEMYAAQVKGYSAGTSDFEKALSSATKDKPVVYSPYSGYGYVYNLLLGVSEAQKADIEAIKSTDTTARATERKSILAATTAKDLRSTWILSGYDFEYDEAAKTGKFTGDYTANKDVSLAFQGEVSRLAEKDKEKNISAEYRIDSVKTFGLDEFIAFMEEYVYGSVQNKDVASSSDDTVNWYKKVTHGRVDNYDDKINELLFAFSTDSGSLNTYKGYVVNPYPDADSTESFVSTFADAGRKLLTMGGSSYIVVASDYGYHIVFFSEALSANTGYATLDDYLNSLDDTKGGFASWSEYLNDILSDWDKYEDSDFYLYKLASIFTDASTAYTNKQTEIVKAAKADKEKVKIYSERYADLG